LPVPVRIKRSAIPSIHKSGQTARHRSCKIYWSIIMVARCTRPPESTMLAKLSAGLGVQDIVLLIAWTRLEFPGIVN
jgi:hypothetical protein